ncbi:MAG: helix-turn-helix domain-containing protein [Nanoarchaeota archaeon]
MLQELKKLGLPENEAIVYIELLKRGPISVNELSKKISFDRTLTYQVLNNLVEKGLANYIIKENKKYFSSSDPENLLNPVKEQESVALHLIPKLKTIEKVKEKDQEVRVYEGKKGLRTFVSDMMKYKDFCFFGATGKSYDVLQYELPHLAKKGVQLGLKGRMITSKEFKGHEMTKVKNIKVRYLEEVKSPATTSIYGDKVAIHVLTDKPIVVIIKNKDIADSYRSYFEFLWKLGKG